MSAGPTASPSPVRRTSPARRVSWWALAAVVIVALVIGARAPGPAPVPAQRAATIEANLRCPSCEDISVLQSSAPVAVAIRHTVAARVAAGQGADTIENYLVSRYGPSVLLRPPASGGVGVVWLIPVLAIAAALAGLGVFFWRRRRLVPVVVSDDDRRLVDEALAASSDHLGAPGSSPEPWR